MRTGQSIIRKLSILFMFVLYVKNVFRFKLTVYMVENTAVIYKKLNLQSVTVNTLDHLF